MSSRMKTLEVDVIIKAIIRVPEDANEDDVVNSIGAFLLSSRKAYDITDASIDDIDVVKRIRRGRSK